MEFIGFSEETAKWFKSDLSNRKFNVHIKNNFSEPEKILCRVPQKSILGMMGAKRNRWGKQKGPPS